MFAFLPLGFVFLIMFLMLIEGMVRRILKQWIDYKERAVRHRWDRQEKVAKMMGNLSVLEDI